MLNQINSVNEASGVGKIVQNNVNTGHELLVCAFLLILMCILLYTIYKLLKGQCNVKPTTKPKSK